MTDTKLINDYLQHGDNLAHQLHANLATVHQLVSQTAPTHLQLKDLPRFDHDPAEQWYRLIRHLRGGFLVSLDDPTQKVRVTEKTIHDFNLRHDDGVLASLTSTQHKYTGETIHLPHIRYVYCNPHPQPDTIRTFLSQPIVVDKYGNLKCRFGLGQWFVFSDQDVNYYHLQPGDLVEFATYQDQLNTPTWTNHIAIRYVYHQSDPAPSAIQS